MAWKTDSYLTVILFTFQPVHACRYLRDGLIKNFVCSHSLTWKRESLFGRSSAAFSKRLVGIRNMTNPQGHGELIMFCSTVWCSVGVTCVGSWIKRQTSLNLPSFQRVTVTITLYNNTRHRANWFIILTTFLTRFFFFTGMSMTELKFEQDLLKHAFFSLRTC